jgi:hypothetical protein
VRQFHAVIRQIPAFLVILSPSFHAILPKIEGLSSFFANWGNARNATSFRAAGKFVGCRFGLVCLAACCGSYRATHVSAQVTTIKDQC